MPKTETDRVASGRPRHPIEVAAKWAFLGAVLGALINALVPILIALAQPPLPSPQTAAESVAENKGLAPPKRDLELAAAASAEGADLSPTGAAKVFQPTAVPDQHDVRVRFVGGTESVAIVADGRYLISVNVTMNYDQGPIHPYFKCAVRRDGQNEETAVIGGDYTFGVSCGSAFTAELKKGDLLGVIAGQASGIERTVGGSLHVVKVAP